MAPELYSLLFEQIRGIVEKFFDQQGQVRPVRLSAYLSVSSLNLETLTSFFTIIQVIVSDINTLFIEHIIHIMKSILEGRQNKEQNEQPQISEHLGVTSIEGMMLGIVRYVRHLDMTVHAIHIKTKVTMHSSPMHFLLFFRKIFFRFSTFHANS